MHRELIMTTKISTVRAAVVQAGAVPFDSDACVDRAAALIGDLILLPAVLAGSLGRVLTHQKVRARHAAKSAGGNPRAPVPAPHAWTASPLAAPGRPAYTDR